MGCLVCGSPVRVCCNVLVVLIVCYVDFGGFGGCAWVGLSGVVPVLGFPFGHW